MVEDKSTKDMLKARPVVLSRSTCSACCSVQRLTMCAPPRIADDQAHSDIAQR